VLDREPAAGADAHACRHWLASFGGHLERACLAPPLQRTGRHGAGLREVEIVRVAHEAALVLRVGPTVEPMRNVALDGDQIAFTAGREVAGGADSRAA
jgi:hypothetical protein